MNDLAVITTPDSETRRLELQALRRELATASHDERRARIAFTLMQSVVAVCGCAILLQGLMTVGALPPTDAPAWRLAGIAAAAGAALIAAWLIYTAFVDRRDLSQSRRFRFERRLAELEDDNAASS